jgi:glycine dehydrogenase subunit 2
MKLLYEKGAPGRGLSILPKLDVPEAEIPAEFAREKAPRLAFLSETEISRHYTQLAGRTHGVNDGFYPLGSCTMKYNPKIDEEMAALPGFTGVHPLQPEADAQGCLEVLYRLRAILCEVTGMSGMTFQPAAGAHGEQTGLLTIKAYHKHRGDLARTKVIVPDSAHGTNPASATMAGMTVISRMLWSKMPSVLGLVSISPAVSGPTARFSAVRSTQPSGLEGMETTVRPAIAAEAGLVPWAESGTMTFVRALSPRSLW